MQINKSINSFGYKEYEFIKDNKIFKISFMGNGDLYWSLTNLNVGENLDYDIFTITADDNYDIYSLFYKLFLNIKNANIYETDNEFLYYNYQDNFELSIKRHNKNKLWSQRLKQKECYQELFDGEKITWISDDRDYDKDQIVQISKKDNSFILEFARKDKKDKDIYHYLSSFSSYLIGIRFRNSGSSYDPFNLAFMDMYNALDKYFFSKTNHDEIEGQTCMEEYAKLLRKN